VNRKVRILYVMDLSTQKILQLKTNIEIGYYLIKDQYEDTREKNYMAIDRSDMEC